MKFLTHSLALGALLLCHYPLSTCVDSSQIVAYSEPEFVSYDLIVPEFTLVPEPSDVVPASTEYNEVLDGGAEKPGHMAWKAPVDYG